MSQNTQYLFKDSQFDFDETLIGAGYEIINDALENQVIFQKNLMANKAYDPNLIRPNGPSFKINVTRPKMLFSNGRYEAISPYGIIFIYQTIPMLLIRKIQWDTFPGFSSDVLADVLNQCEAEAEAILTMFLDVDVKNITYHRENQQQPENTETSQTPEIAKND